MALPTKWLEDLQSNVSELISKSPVADLDKNLKSFLSQGLSKLDLVSREEFEVQQALVQRLIARVSALEKALEKETTEDQNS